MEFDIDHARMDVLRAALFAGANVLLTGEIGCGKSSRIAEVAALDGHDVARLGAHSLTTLGYINEEGEISRPLPKPVVELTESQSPLLLIDHIDPTAQSQPLADLEYALASIFWERSLEGHQLPRVPIVLVAYSEINENSRPPLLYDHGKTPLTPHVSDGALGINLSDEQFASSVFAIDTRLQLMGLEEAGILREPNAASREQATALLRKCLPKGANQATKSFGQQSSRTGYLVPTFFVGSREWRRWRTMQLVLQHLNNLRAHHIAVLTTGIFGDSRAAEIESLIALD